MAVSRRGRRSRWTLVLLVITSIAVLTLDFRGSSSLEPLRNGASTVFGPVRSAADRVLDPLSNAWNGAWHYDSVQKENEQLRAQLDEMRGQQMAAQAALNDRNEIAKAGGLTVVSDIPQVLAQVSSGAISNFAHTIELNQGSNKGVKVGNPVVTGAGLVGRIVQVSSDHSVVRLVTDPDFPVGVRLTTSNQIGVAHGTGNGGPLRIESGIDPTADVPVGDVVTTSGLDRAIFPPLVPVGTVATADLSADQLSKIVTVTPAADLTRLAYVTVLLWEPPS